MKAQISKKRILYTICFIMLNILDFVRNTQNGDTWGAAVNVTGLVMMVIIGSVWPLKSFLLPGVGVWTLGCIGVSAYALLSIRSSGMDIFMGMYVWTFVLAVANVWWIAIFLLRMGKKLWREKKLAVRFGGTSILWIILTLLMMFSRSGRVWPIWFLAMFGMFYLTEYSKEDGKALVDGLIDGTIISFFMLQIFAYGFRPYDAVRYVGAFANSNMAALHYLIVYAILLMKLHLLQKKGASRWWKLFYLTGACGMLGFMFLTMGRTSWGIAIVLTLVYGFLVMRQSWRQNWGQIILRGAALGLGALLLFPAVFMSVRWLPTILHHPIWFLDEYNENKVHSFDPADSWKYVEIDEFLETVLGRIWGTFQSNAGNPFKLAVTAAESQGRESNQSQDQESGRELEPEQKQAATVTESQGRESDQSQGQEQGRDQEPEQGKELVGSEGMDASLNIRLSIYKAYFRDLNLLGHTQTEGMYRFEGTNYYARHAQNLWLEAAYRYGITAGIVFSLLTVWLLIYHFRRLRHSETIPQSVIPLLVCLVFFGYGIMELVWNTGQYILILFFIVQHPLFYQKGKQDVGNMEFTV